MINSCYCISLVIRNSKPCQEHRPLPLGHVAQNSLLAPCSEYQLQLKKCFEINSISTSFLLCLPSALRQMPLAFKVGFNDVL